MCTPCLVLSPPLSQMFLHREEWEGEGLTGYLCRLWVIVSAAVPIYMKFGLPGLSSTVLSVPQGSMSVTPCY